MSAREVKKRSEMTKEEIEQAEKEYYEESNRILREMFPPETEEEKARKLEMARAWHRDAHLHRVRRVQVLILLTRKGREQLVRVTSDLEEVDRVFACQDSDELRDGVISFIANDHGNDQAQAYGLWKPVSFTRLDTEEYRKV